MNCINKKGFFAAIAVICSIVLASCGIKSENLPKENIDRIKTATAGDVIWFGTCFWRVLDVEDGKALIISDHVLEGRAYHLDEVDVTWAESDMREYLNGSFIEETFTQEEKALIIETVLENKDNQWYGTEGGEQTLDKVFLLSLEELVQYFGDSGQLENGNDISIVISDEYNDKRIAYDARGHYKEWWLRSPGGTSHSAACVAGGVASEAPYPGEVNVNGIRVATNNGVRPALWINLE